MKCSLNKIEDSKFSNMMAKKVHYFASIYEYFLFHKGVRVGAKALLAVLHAKSYKCKDFREGKPQATVSQAELADKLGVDTRTIQNWLEELKAVGAITVVAGSTAINRTSIYCCLRLICQEPSHRRPVRM